jgi:hypothetical protein
MKYHSVAAVQPLRSFAKQFGLGFHPKVEAFAAMPMLEEDSEWAVSVKKVASHKRFSVRFSFLEGLLVYAGEFTLISPVGVVKPFLTLIRASVLKLLRWMKGGAEDSRSGPQRRIKNDRTRGASLSRFIFYIFCF